MPPEPPKQIVITLSPTERIIASEFLSLGIAEVQARINRGQHGLDGRLRAARRILLMIREAK